MHENNCDFNAILASEKWHKPYALALLESDPASLEMAIGETEKAIFTRYLELCVSPGTDVLYRDLYRALGVLSELKRLPASSNRELFVGCTNETCLTA